MTVRLNAVYGSEDSRLPRSLRRLQSRSLARDTLRTSHKSSPSTAIS